MDTRLEKALEFSKYMETLNNQKRILYSQFQENTIYYHGGGAFTITPALISYIQNLVALGDKDIVLIDDNNNPIKIEDISEVLDKIVSCYKQSCQEYYTSYDSLRKNRSVEKIIND